ncbi:MAG: PfkB family carbohydrate kinase [Elusimicrobiaceae bacterium]|nr:PfkB family carbohydrate kinase [Elusimicrobiaceae bacterium]
MKKILSIQQLAEKVADLKKSGKTVVLCHGVFDLMHPGHIRHLQTAKKEGDILVVTVTPDRYVNKGPGRPVFSENLRAETLAALGAVDYAAVNEWPNAVETLKTVKPSVYIKGSDYAAPDQDITGGIALEKEAVESVGGQLRFTNDIQFSSTALLNRFFGTFPEPTRQWLQDFRARHSPDSVIDAMRALKKLRVLVVGDVIVDEYHYCSGLGKSPKDNIITTRYLGEERFAGGALACANHLAGFCEEVTLVTCLGGMQTHEDYIRLNLKPNIRPEFFVRPDTCTVVKRRFVEPVFLTKLFEVAFLDDRPLPDDVCAGMAAHLERIAGDYDLVLVSDFGHGLVDERIIGALKNARFLTVNAQSNSANHGYNLVTKYHKADYICIDEPELRLASHDKYGDIHALIKGLSQKLDCPCISITRGHLGAITYRRELGFFETPVFSGKIVDRVGAGDSYLSVTAPMAAAGLTPDLIGFTGNAAAAIKVGIVCNKQSVEPLPLFRFINTLLK